METGSLEPPHSRSHPARLTCVPCAPCEPVEPLPEEVAEENDDGLLSKAVLSIAATLSAVEAAAGHSQSSPATERLSGGDLGLATARFRATFPDVTSSDGDEPTCTLDDLLPAPGCVPDPRAALPPGGGEPGVQAEAEEWSCFPPGAASALADLSPATATAASASALLLETLGSAVRALSGTAARSGEETPGVAAPAPKADAQDAAAALDEQQQQQQQQEEELALAVQEEPSSEVVHERETIRSFHQVVARTPSLRPGVKALDQALGVTLRLHLSEAEAEQAKQEKAVNDAMDDSQAQAEAVAVAKADAEEHQAQAVESVEQAA